MKNIKSIYLLLATTIFWVSCDTTPEVGPTAPEFVTFTGSSTVNAFENAGPVTLSVITSSKDGVTVTVSSSSEEAVEDVDYSIATSTVQIGADVYKSSFEVDIIDNFVEDGNRSFVVSLSTDEMSLGGASDVTITIIDNDCDYDRTLIDGVLVGTDERPFNGQRFASVADFTYVSPTLLQAVGINNLWMEGYWQEAIQVEYPVDIVVDANTLALTISEQPIMETIYSNAPYSYTIIGSGSIDTCGEVMIISYMMYEGGNAIRASNFTLTVALPQPAL